VNDRIRRAVKPLRQLFYGDPLSLMSLEVTVQASFKRHFFITSDALKELRRIKIDAMQ
jgi:hypothetical protein